MDGSRKRCLDEADEVDGCVVGRGWAWLVLVLMVGERKKRIEAGVEVKYSRRFHAKTRSTTF
jgi:hypothetical protein